MSLLRSLWGSSVQEGDAAEKKEDEQGEDGKAKGYSETTSMAYWAKGLGGLVSSVGSYANELKERVSTTVQSTVESTSILSEFDQEQRKFEREQQRQKDCTMPPWVGFKEEEQMKAQILELSVDSRNVLRAPPPGIEFNFNFSKCYPVALALLKEDPRLQALRFELVPKKVKEEKFWHNYFYRVFLIKQSSQLSSLASEEHKADSSVALAASISDGSSSATTPVTTTPALSFTDISTSENTHEVEVSDDFASDALQAGGGAGGEEEREISRESVREELDQLGIEAGQLAQPHRTDVEGEEGLDGEEWEEEIAKELESFGLEVGGGEEDEEAWEQELKLMLDSHTTESTTS